MPIVSLLDEKPMIYVYRVYLQGCRIWPVYPITDPFEIFKEREKWREEDVNGRKNL